MSIRIITDSTCDLSPAQLQVLDIDFIPLSVYFGQEQYLDKVELSPEAFYQKLGQSKELPTTSQVNPDTFISHFQSELEKGHEIVGIFLSSRLSGTFQSAVIAKDQLQNEPTKYLFIVTPFSSVSRCTQSGSISITRSRFCRIRISLVTSVPAFALKVLSGRRIAPKSSALWAIYLRTSGLALSIVPFEVMNITPPPARTLSNAFAKKKSCMRNFWDSRVVKKPTIFCIPVTWNGIMNINPARAVQKRSRKS